MDALSDLKGNDVVALDVSNIAHFTDYMIIASGTSNRHVRSLVDHIIEKAKAAGNRPVGTEGQSPGEWILVDLGDVVAHVMLPTTRDYYDLERLWGTGATRQTLAEWETERKTRQAAATTPRGRARVTRGSRAKAPANKSRRRSPRRSVVETD